MNSDNTKSYNNTQLLCNNENIDYIFKKINMKSIVLDYIFSSLNFKNINERKLTQQNINLIDNINFIVEPIVKGLKCLCVIFKNKNNFYSCLIEKKQLYKKEQIQLSDIKISNFNIKFSNINIYNGTILDGIYIHNNTSFIINDIYYIDGENLLKTPINIKFMQFNNYLNIFQMSYFNMYMNNFMFLEKFNDDTKNLLHNPLINKNNQFDINNLIIGYKILSIRTHYYFNIFTDETYYNKFNNNNIEDEQDIDNINPEYREKLNDINFKYNKQPLKKNINNIPELRFMFNNNKLYLRQEVAYNVENNKYIFLPFYICEFDYNLSEIKNINILNNNDIVDCKITNNGIIPYNISPISKPDNLNLLIDLLDFNN